jgi:erythromycin esterase-like protein
MTCLKITALVAGTAGLLAFSPGVAAARVQSPPTSAIASHAVPIGRYDGLIAAIGGSTRILLGESSHGTSEYYRERARLTRRLIAEKGVRAIVIEGDWSPTLRVNHYVRGIGTDRSAEQALESYRGRYPQWLWRNTDFRDFVEQLRASNLERPPKERVGIYGMDVYDLYGAADVVTTYLKRIDPKSAERVAKDYSCFAPYGREPLRYSLAARRGVSCQRQAEDALAVMRAVAAPRDEQWFEALGSAESVLTAEEAYRVTGPSGWNLRDRRMADRVEEIARHVGGPAGNARLAIWTHNTHSGDARATSSAKRGQVSLGQLMKQRHGSKAFLLGMVSYGGTVFAASRWDAPGQVFAMPAAIPESYSAALHDAAISSSWLLLKGNPAVRAELSRRIVERAIGVVYLPSDERRNHYSLASLPDQFDALVYFDRSDAIRPL